MIAIGNPIRDFRSADNDNILKLKGSRPLLFIIGGSQGAKQINDLIFEVLGLLLKEYEIIHQVGLKHIIQAKEASMSAPSHLRICIIFTIF